jgi:hypothetical protein
LDDDDWISTSIDIHFIRVKLDRYGYWYIVIK